MGARELGLSEVVGETGCGGAVAEWGCRGMGSLMEGLGGLGGFGGRLWADGGRCCCCIGGGGCGNVP